MAMPDEKTSKIIKNPDRASVSLSGESVYKKRSSRPFRPWHDRNKKPKKITSASFTLQLRIYSKFVYARKR